MTDLLDQTIPEASEYLGGRLRGYSLRTLFRKKRIIDTLLRDPRFKEQHRQLFYDIEFLRAASSLYGGAELRAPRPKGRR